MAGHDIDRLCQKTGLRQLERGGPKHGGCGLRVNALGTLLRLRAGLDRVQAAAEASGFQGELWSYEIRDGRLIPVRYGISSDVQLWSTTDLAVQFALSRLQR
jgi:hypothetical protein